MTSGGDAEGRDPKNWTVQGSNDGSTWTDLDQRTNEDFATRGLPRTFEITSEGEPVAYTFYRLNITANSGDPLIQLADWDLSSDLGRPAGRAPRWSPSSGPARAAARPSRRTSASAALKALRYAGSHRRRRRARTRRTCCSTSPTSPVGPNTRLSYKIFPELLNDLAVPVDVRGRGPALHRRQLPRPSSAPSTSTATPFTPARPGRRARSSTPTSGTRSASTSATSPRARRSTASCSATTTRAGHARDPLPGLARRRRRRPRTPRSIDGSQPGQLRRHPARHERDRQLLARQQPPGDRRAERLQLLHPDDRRRLARLAVRLPAGRTTRTTCPCCRASAISHEPSPWMGDRNQMSRHARRRRRDARRGALAARALEFGHADETAQPDYYGSRSPTASRPRCRRPTTAG